MSARAPLPRPTFAARARPRPAAFAFLAALALAGGTLRPAAAAHVPAGVPVARLTTKTREIALSFDDGPQPTPVLDSLLAILGARGVHATFFVIGEELVAHPEIGRRLLAAGEELGNHSWTHPRFDSIGVDSMRRELARTDSLIRALGGRGRILVRPPYGVLDDADVAELKHRHRTVALFDVDPSYDVSDTVSADSLARYTLWMLGPGSILVMHPWYEGGERTLAALPEILDRLAAMGYRVETVSRLLKIRHAKVEPSLYHDIGP